jgi:hypothetical protein
MLVGAKHEEHVRRQLPLQSNDILMQKHAIFIIIFAMLVLFIALVLLLRSRNEVASAERLLEQVRTPTWQQSVFLNSFAVRGRSSWNNELLEPAHPHQ